MVTSASLFYSGSLDDPSRDTNTMSRDVITLSRDVTGSDTDCRYPQRTSPREESECFLCYFVTCESEGGWSSYAR